jgi:hypothetical protein
MQADPTARHSLIGPFQRVCYLVHAGARTHRSNVGALAAAGPIVRGRHAVHRHRSSPNYLSEAGP